MEMMFIRLEQRETLLLWQKDGYVLPTVSLIQCILFPIAPITVIR